ncbi:hypothetical protein YC2023_026749 [Brassica napus]
MGKIHCLKDFSRLMFILLECRKDTIMRNLFIRYCLPRITYGLFRIERNSRESTNLLKANEETRKVPLRGGFGLRYLRPEILRVLRVGQFRVWANAGRVDAGLRGIRDPRVFFTRDVWCSANRRKR